MAPTQTLEEQPAADQRELARLGAQVRERLANDPSVYRVPIDRAEIFAVAGFVSPDECARLIAIIDDVAQPSKVFEHSQAAYRTSYSGDVDPWDSFVQKIERQFAGLLGIELCWGETMQGQRYGPGQEFREHYDWFDPAADYWTDELARGGQRSWTAMAYLNDVEEGGITDFPRIGVTIPPQAGALLIWNNALPDGRPNADVLHASQPVIRGLKYVITKWFRTAPGAEPSGSASRVRVVRVGLPSGVERGDREIDPTLDADDLELGAQVDLVIMPRGDAVLLRLAVLAHHDHRRLDRRKHRQHQVEEDVRIGIERVQPEHFEDAAVDQHPGDKHQEKSDDEAPAAADRGNPVGQAIGEARMKRGLLVGVGTEQRARCDPHEHVLLFRIELVELAPDQLFGELFRRIWRAAHRAPRRSGGVYWRCRTA